MAVHCEIDWGKWPLIEIDASSLPGEEFLRVVARTLREALDRDEEFAAVVWLPVAEGRRLQFNVHEQVRVANELWHGLEERCRGMAFVAPPIERRDGEVVRPVGRTWGCPTTTTADAEQARTWARDRLASAGLWEH